jgi:hypothetical protein
MIREKIDLRDKIKEDKNTKQLAIKRMRTKLDTKNK